MSYAMQNPHMGPAGTSQLGQAAGGFKEKIPKGYRAGALQQFDPLQMGLYEQLFSHVGPESYLSKLAGGDEQFFEQMEAPAHRQFQELTGQLASRFSGSGMGARRGSGFQNALGQSAIDFSTNLKSKRDELRRQALSDLMGLSGQLLGQRPTERLLTEKQKPWWQSALVGFSGGLGEGLGQAAGSFAGG